MSLMSSILKLPSTVQQSIPVVAQIQPMQTSKKTPTAQLPSWITYWAIIASLLVSIDCFYVMGVYYGFQRFMPSVVLSLWGWYGESDSQYSESGMKDGHGWVMAQSIFNVFELLAQLAFVFILRRGSVEALLTIMLSSMATLWKTLIYMCIIIYSDDPVRVVPGLFCLGYSPKPENLAEVLTLLNKDSCGTQLFKFQFNFWWIAVPLLIVHICWRRIANAFSHLLREKAN